MRRSVRSIDAMLIQGKEMIIITMVSLIFIIYYLCIISIIYLTLLIFCINILVLLIQSFTELNFNNINLVLL